LKVNPRFIIPAVIAFSIFGAYSARNDIFDIFIAIIFGLIGLIFKRTQIPIAPAVLGMILGSMAEQNLRQSMVIAAAKDINILAYITIRPISIILIALISLLIWGNFKAGLRADD
jgi:putative tricarboxylic transport membrane protein